MLKPVLKRFSIQIETELQTVSKSFELDKNIRHVKGMLLTSDKDDLMYLRGTQRIEINKEEIFPENYESKLLMSSLSVPPNCRYYDLGEIAVGNGSVKLEFTDNADGRTKFEPYRVSIYLLCQMEDEL